jgi:hypothetical protein
LQPPCVQIVRLAGKLHAVRCDPPLPLRQDIFLSFERATRCAAELAGSHSRRLVDLTGHLTAEECDILALEQGAWRFEAPSEVAVALYEQNHGHRRLG